MLAIAFSLFSVSALCAVPTVGHIMLEPGSPVMTAPIANLLPRSFERGPTLTKVLERQYRLAADYIGGNGSTVLVLGTSKGLILLPSVSRGQARELPVVRVLLNAPSAARVGSNPAYVRLKAEALSQLLENLERNDFSRAHQALDRAFDAAKPRADRTSVIASLPAD